MRGLLRQVRAVEVPPNHANKEVKSNMDRYIIHILQTIGPRIAALHKDIIRLRSAAPMGVLSPQQMASPRNSASTIPEPSASDSTPQDYRPALVRGVSSIDGGPDTSNGNASDAISSPPPSSSSMSSPDASVDGERRTQAYSFIANMAARGSKLYGAMTSSKQPSDRNSLTAPSASGSLSPPLQRLPSVNETPNVSASSSSQPPMPAPQPVTAQSSSSSDEQSAGHGSKEEEDAIAAILKQTELG
jgi:hypothetical protein